MQLRDFPARRFAAASAKVAAEQIAAYVRSHGLACAPVVASRLAASAERHRAELDRRAAPARPSAAAPRWG